jgi:hypothetical protein
MRLLLTRKFADEIDGVDLKTHQVGDVIDLPLPEGRLLIAEEWAIPERRSGERLSNESVRSVSQDSHKGENRSRLAAQADERERRNASRS